VGGPPGAGEPLVLVAAPPVVVDAATCPVSPIAMLPSVPLVPPV
jgi:hypothetical protein